MAPATCPPQGQALPWAARCLFFSGLVRCSCTRNQRFDSREETKEWYWAGPTPRPRPMKIATPLPSCDCSGQLQRHLSLVLLGRSTTSHTRDESLDSAAQNSSALSDPDFAPRRSPVSDARRGSSNHRQTLCPRRISSTSAFFVWGWGEVSDFEVRVKVCCSCRVTPENRCCGCGSITHTF